MVDEPKIVEPTELLVRWFRRSKTDTSQELDIGDFDRVTPKDTTGISVWRISYITPQKIYDNFKPQKMGLFSAQAEKLTAAGYKLECSESQPEHVDLCCSKWDIKRDEQCRPLDGTSCPLIEQPGHQITELMKFFHLCEEAEHRLTAKGQSSAQMATKSETDTI